MPHPVPPRMQPWLLDVWCYDGRLPDPGSLDPAQTDGRAQDDARRFHAAQRVLEQNCIVLPGALADFTVRPHHVNPVDAGAETPVLVVIFAVDVCRNGAAERDEPSLGRDHREPAAGQECSDDVAEKNTGFGNELTGGRIESRHPVEMAHFDSGGGVDNAIAIGAAIAVSDEARLTQNQFPQRVHVARTMRPCLHHRIPFPARQLHVGTANRRFVVIEVILNDVADREPQYRAQFAHNLRLSNKPERRLRLQKISRREKPHGDVEREFLAVVLHAGLDVVENLAFVEQVIKSPA